MLFVQSLNYALEPWACANQLVYPLHISAACGFAVTAACAAISWREWQAVGGTLPDDRAGDDSRKRFFAVIALMTSSLSMLGIAALWAAQLVVPPCVR
jgi:hypothetical protein